MLRSIWTFAHFRRMYTTALPGVCICGVRWPAACGSRRPGPGPGSRPAQRHATRPGGGWRKALWSRAVDLLWQGAVGVNPLRFAFETCGRAVVLLGVRSTVRFLYVLLGIFLLCFSPERRKYYTIPIHLGGNWRRNLVGGETWWGGGLKKHKKVPPYTLSLRSSIDTRIYTKLNLDQSRDFSGYRKALQDTRTLYRQSCHIF